MAAPPGSTSSSIPLFPRDAVSSTILHSARGRRNPHPTPRKTTPVVSLRAPQDPTRTLAFLKTRQPLNSASGDPGYESRAGLQPRQKDPSWQSGLGVVRRRPTRNRGQKSRQTHSPFVALSDRQGQCHEIGGAPTPVDRSRRTYGRRMVTGSVPACPAYCCTRARSTH